LNEVTPSPALGSGYRQFGKLLQSAVEDIHVAIAGDARTFAGLGVLPEGPGSVRLGHSGIVFAILCQPERIGSKSGVATELVADKEATRIEHWRGAKLAFDCLHKGDAFVSSCLGSSSPSQSTGFGVEDGGKSPG
jgi:hypothetical protein